MNKFNLIKLWYIAISTTNNIMSEIRVKRNLTHLVMLAYGKKDKIWNNRDEIAFISYKYALYPSYKCIFRNIVFKSNTTEWIYDHELTHICFLMIMDWYSQFRVFIAIYVLGNILDIIKIDQFSNAMNLTLKVGWVCCLTDHRIQTSGMGFPAFITAFIGEIKRLEAPL